MTTYIGILTDYGKEAILNALSEGTTIEIASIAYGDGAGATYTPVASQTQLRNQIGVLSSITKDVSDGWVYFESTIPANIPTFTLRELGLIDADGHLLVIANTPESVKPVSTLGAEVSLPVGIGLTTSQGSVLIVEVSPGIEYATKSYVLQAIN